LACRGHHELILENLALRQQLRALQRTMKRPRRLRARDDRAARPLLRRFAGWSARWQPPTRSGARRAFTANCRSSASKYPACYYATLQCAVRVHFATKNGKVPARAVTTGPSTGWRFRLGASGQVLRTTILFSGAPPHFVAPLVSSVSIFRHRPTLQWASLGWRVDRISFTSPPASALSVSRTDAGRDVLRHREHPTLRKD
jgi:hypothetical protein